MLAINKLRVTWCKQEQTRLFHTPAGDQTKCDGHLMNGYITDELVKELDERGYDVATMKFSIEPKKGDQRFASQRE